jgi:hypothetical protein
MKQTVELKRRYDLAQSGTKVTTPKETKVRVEDRNFEQNSPLQIPSCLYMVDETEIQCP